LQLTEKRIVAICKKILCILIIELIHGKKIQMEHFLVFYSNQKKFSETGFTKLLLIY